MNGVANAAQTLLGFGITAEKVMPTIKQIGDISMGNEERFKSLSLAFAQMSATGKLMGQDLLQMINAGFNPLQTISEKTGKSIGDLKKEMENGSISSQMVADAFASATAEGGKFYGMTQKQAEGIRGLQDAFNEIGKSQEGLIAGGYKLAISLVENYETIGKAIARLITTYGVYKAAVILASQAEAGWNVIQLITYNRLLLVEKAQKFLNATMLENPYVLVATVAMSVVSVMWAMERSSSEAEEAMKKANEALANGEAAALAEQKELVRLRVELERTTKGTDAYNKVKQEIIDKFGKYLPGLEQEINKVGLLTATYDKLTQAIRKSSLARAKDDALKNISEDYKKNVQDSLKDIRKVIDELNGSDENKERLYRDLYDAILNGNENIIDTQTINRLNSLKEKRGKINKEEYDKEVNSLNFVNRALYKNEELYKAVVQAKKDNQKLSDEQAAINKLFPDDLGKVSAEAVQAGDDFKSAADKYNEAAKKYNVSKKYFEHIDANKTMYSSEAWKAAKDEYEAAKKAYEEVSSTSIKQGESAAEKARKQAQEIADQNEKIKQLEDKQSLERRRQDEDLANQETQARINAMSDGSEKIRAQQEYNNKLEIQTIERRKEDYIRSIIQAEQEKFDAQEELEQKKNPKYTKKTFNASSVKVDTSKYDNIVGFKIASDIYSDVEASNKAWNEYLLQFGNYQEKRKAIIEKYNKEMAQATQDGEKAILEKNKQNALDDLDNSVKNSTALMGQLFADSSQKSVSEIQKIIDKAEMLMQYLAAVKDEQGNANINGKTVSKQDILGLGITDNTLKNLELSTEEVEALRNAINKLKSDLGDKSPFKLFEKQIGDAINKIKQGGKKNIAQGISEIGNATSQFAPEVAEFGKNLGNIVGDDELGSKIEGVADAIGDIGEAAQGVGQIMSGDVVGGVMSVVSGISKAVDALDGLFGADYSGYEKLKAKYENLLDIWDDLIDRKKEYLSTSVADEVARAEKEALDSINKQTEVTKKLAEARLASGSSAGSHSLWYRMWKGSYKFDGKNWQDVAGSISKELGVSFTKMEDMLNMSSDQLLWIKENYSGLWAVMDDDFRGYLEQLIEYGDQAQDIINQAKESLTGISFDNLKDSFLNTLLDMSSDAEDFTDDFVSYFQKAIMQTMLDKQFSERLQSFYDSFAEANKVGGIDSSEYNKLQDQWSSIVNDALSERDKLKDIFGWTDDNSSSSQSSSYGSPTSMDQETGGAILGRVTGIHEVDLLIEQNTYQLMLLTTESNQLIKGYKEDFMALRNVLVESRFILEEIRDSNNELYEIKDTLIEIKKNTKGLI